ncbi:MAG: RidA family protein [Chloroflexi bacterium]|nr:RidA family protein [Chloroflexota bacterium]
MTVGERLKAQGIEVPGARRPAGNYVTAVQTGNLVFTAGQIGGQNNTIGHTGKVGSDLTVEQGYEAAKAAALNCLAAIKGLIGDLDRVVRVVKVLGFVNSAEGFGQQPKVMNGASDLLVAAFGEQIGPHSRSAVGVYQLPGNAAVEVELIVEVR